MAKAKVRSVGRGATVITLLSNPVIRRVVFKGATKAANSAAQFVAARREKAGPAAPGSPAGSQTRPAAEPGTQPVKRATPAEAATVESIVGSVASMAKPMAERLAASAPGRSVLEAVNSISGQALGTSAPPRRAGASVASFVGGILANQGSQKARPAPDQPAAKFTPIKPPSTPGSEPVKTMVWPPPPKTTDATGS